MSPHFYQLLMNNFCIDRCVGILLHLMLLNLPQSWPDLSNTGVCFNNLVLLVTGCSSEARAKRCTYCFCSITCLDINTVVTCLPFVSDTEGAQKEQEHNNPEPRER